MADLPRSNNWLNHSVHLSNKGKASGGPIQGFSFASISPALTILFPGATQMKYGARIIAMLRQLGPRILCGANLDPSHRLVTVSIGLSKKKKVELSTEKALGLRTYDQMP